MQAKMENKTKRKFSPYEKNLLMKLGYDIDLVSSEIPHDMPIEYFLKTAEFCGQFFEVNKKVLIPRIETEQLLDLCIEEIKSKFQKIQHFNIAEIGTGSGCISIILAKKLNEIGSNFTILATDISSEVLKIAQKNYRKILGSSEFLKNPNRIDFLQSDLFNKIQKNKFDLIVANLPYIPTKWIKSLDTSVSNYEPVLALNGGLDGFSLIYKLLMQSTKFLDSDGTIILEVNNTHTHKFVKSNYPILLQIWSLNFVSDQYSKNRFIIARKKQS